MNILSFIRQYPKNHLFYSPICGNCTYQQFTDDYIIMKDINNQRFVFNHQGQYLITNSYSVDCLLFPTKTCKNWVKSLEDKFNPFDKVVVRDSKNQIWGIDFFCCYSTWENKRPFICIGQRSWNYCLPYNEITKQLIGKQTSLEGLKQELNYK